MYTATTWTNGSGNPISAANLDKIENELVTAYRSLISDLKALVKSDLNDGDRCHVLGHTTIGMGGGDFRWDATDTTTDDDGIYIQLDEGGTGRWIRERVGKKVYAEWYGAVSGVTFTPGVDSNDGGVVTTGTSQHTPIQAAITAAGEGGVAVIAHPYFISTGLTISNGSDLIQEGANSSLDELQDGTLPGLYTSSDIALVTITTKKSRCRGLMLVGSGNINDGNDPQTSVVGTGIDCQVGTVSFHDIQFRNLKVGFIPNNVTTINFFNTIFRYCVDGVLPADDDVCNNINFFGGSAQVCDYVLRNSGSTSAEQSKISFKGFHFEWLVRAVKGDFDNVSFDDCWFERISTTGLDQSRSNDDNVPLEPLGGAQVWNGENNQFSSTANSSLTAAGISCTVGGWHSAAGEYRRLNYGLNTELTESRLGSNRIVYDNEIHQDLTLEIPTLEPTDVTVTGDTVIGHGASLHITSATSTPRVIGITGTAAAKGSVVRVVNGTANSVDFVDSDAGASVGDKLLLNATFTLAKWTTVDLTYNGTSWQADR